MRILVTLAAILALPCTVLCDEPVPYEEAEQEACPDQQCHSRVEQQIADLVDEYNKLVKADRWAEAEMIGKRAMEVDKNNRIAIIMFEKARIGRQIARNADLQIRGQNEDQPGPLELALSSKHDTSIYRLQHVAARQAIPAIRDAVAKALSAQPKDDPARCENMSLTLIPTTADDALVAICPREQAALVKTAIESCDVARQYAVKVSISELGNNGNFVGDAIKFPSCLLIGRDGTVECKTPNGEMLTLTLKVAGSAECTAAPASTAPCACAEDEEQACDKGVCANADSCRSELECNRGLIHCSGTCSTGICSTGTCSSGTCVKGTCSKATCAAGTSCCEKCSQCACAAGKCCSGARSHASCQGSCSGVRCANCESNCDEAACGELKRPCVIGDAERSAGSGTCCSQCSGCRQVNTCVCENQGTCAACRGNGHCACHNAHPSQTADACRNSGACISCRSQDDGRTVISISNCQNVTINTAAPAADAASQADTVRFEAEQEACPGDATPNATCPNSNKNGVTYALPPGFFDPLGNCLLRDAIAIPPALPSGRAPTVASDMMFSRPPCASESTVPGCGGSGSAEQETMLAPPCPAAEADQCETHDGSAGPGTLVRMMGPNVRSSNVNGEPPALLSIPQRPDATANADSLITIPKWQSELLKYYHGRGLSEIFNAQPAHDSLHPIRSRLLADIPKSARNEAVLQTFPNGLIVVDSPDRLRIFESAAPAANLIPAVSAPVCSDCREELRTVLEELFRASDLVDKVTQAGHTENEPAAADAPRELPSVKHSKIETSVVTYPLRDLVLLDEAGRPVFDTCTIIDHLQGAVAPDTWAHPSVSIQLDQQSVSLVIRQTPEVHAKIEAYLSYLRRLQVKQLCDLIERLSTDAKAASGRRANDAPVRDIRILSRPATAPGSNQ